MKIDDKLKELPFSKSNPKELQSKFGNPNIEPMWIADMDFQIAKPIQDSLIERVSNSGFGYEYRPDSYFKAQKKWYDTNYGFNLKMNHVICSPSITTTMSILIENLSFEDNGIIIQPPVYNGFNDVIQKTKRNLVTNPLKLVRQQYLIDFNDLEEKAKVENNKILIICNPHNPIGRVWTKEELRQIVEICKKNNLILISDEIHKDIILFNNQFTSAIQFADYYDKIVVCTSEAKTFNLCGIVDSIAFIPNEEIRKTTTNTLKKYNLETTNALTRVALESAYTNGQHWLSEFIKIVEENIISIEKELENSKIKLIKPEGTSQVWLDFRNVYADTGKMFTHLTKNSEIAISAGHWYGNEGALFMRMNIGTSNEKVTLAIKTLKKAIAKIY